MRGRRIYSHRWTGVWGAAGWSCRGNRGQKGSVVRLRLPLRRSSARMLRTSLARHLALNSVPRHAADDVLLAADEAYINAFIHAGDVDGEVDVRAEVRAGRSAPRDQRRRMRLRTRLGRRVVAARPLQDPRPRPVPDPPSDGRRARALARRRRARHVRPHDQGLWPTAFSGYAGHDVTSLLVAVRESPPSGSRRCPRVVCRESPPSGSRRCPRVAAVRDALSGSRAVRVRAGTRPCPPAATAFDAARGVH